MKKFLFMTKSINDLREKNIIDSGMFILAHIN